MYPCDEYSDLLLDFAYELLDEADANRVRTHVDECSACREQLDEVCQDQDLLATAARIYKHVPEFTPPTLMPAESVEDLFGSAETVVQQNDTVEQPLAPPKKKQNKSMRSRVWPWLTAAAALMIVAGIGYAWHHNEWVQRRSAWKTAQRDVTVTEERIVSLNENVLKAKTSLPGKMGQSQLYVHAYGPTTWHSAAPTPIRIRTRNIDGAPVRANVVMRGRASGQQKPVFETRAQSKAGEVMLHVPANYRQPPGSKLQLEIEASTIHGIERIEQTITAAQPTYRTHIALSKPVYNVGELMFFRTLTLDRFAHTPAAKSFAMCYSLVNSSGKTVKKIFGATAANGVGGGEFALTADLADGEYSLVAAECELGRQGNAPTVVAPQAQRFIVRREEAPALAFDRSAYFTGERVRALYRSGRGNKGAQQRRQPLIAELRSRSSRKNDNNNELIARPVQTFTDDFGNAHIELQLPKLSAQPHREIVLHLHDGTNTEKVRRVLPIVPRWNVEIYPEGGDLVAGVANRVYFRVTAPQSQKPLRAELIDAGGKTHAVTKLTGNNANARTGHIPFTPKLRQRYDLRIMAGKRQVAKQSLPNVKTEGVTMIVANPVADAGAPVQCRVASTNAKSDLLVVASCRGRIVDQRYVELHQGASDVNLDLHNRADGVVRVTTFEVAGDKLTPRAERLVFRRPAKGLRLTVNTARRPDFAYRPGDNAELLVKAQNEKGQAERTWVTAGVVDDDFYSMSAHRNSSLPAYFLGGSWSASSDLEDAQFAVRKDNAGRTALDGYLATAGWRRFGSVQAQLTGKAKAQSGKAQSGSRQTGAAQPVGQPALFSRDNLHRIQGKHNQDMLAELNALELDAQTKRRRLDEKLETERRDLRTALAAFQSFEETPRRWFGMGMGVAVAVLLIGGAGLLLLGFVRLGLGAQSSTATLAAAFASLLLCLGLYAGSGWLPKLYQAEDSKSASADVKNRQLPHLPVIAAEIRRDQPQPRVQLAHVLDNNDATRLDLDQYAATGFAQNNRPNAPTKKLETVTIGQTQVLVAANPGQTEAFLRDQTVAQLQQTNSVRYQTAMVRQNYLQGLLKQYTEQVTDPNVHKPPVPKTTPPSAGGSPDPTKVGKNPAIPGPPTKQSPGRGKGGDGKNPPTPTIPGSTPPGALFPPGLTPPPPIPNGGGFGGFGGFPGNPSRPGAFAGNGGGFSGGAPGNQFGGGSGLPPGFGTGGKKGSKGGKLPGGKDGGGKSGGSKSGGGKAGTGQKGIGKIGDGSPTDNMQRIFAVYEYRNRNTFNDSAVQGTLLWSPSVELPNGSTRLQFDLPNRDGAYRLILFGHSQSGRLGHYAGSLEVRGRRRE